MGDYDGRTALHLASAEGHLRCVRFLLDVCKVNAITMNLVYATVPNINAIEQKNL